MCTIICVHILALWTNSAPGQCQRRWSAGLGPAAVVCLEASSRWCWQRRTYQRSARAGYRWRHPQLWPLLPWQWTHRAGDFVRFVLWPARNMFRLNQGARSYKDVKRENRFMIFEWDNLCRADLTVNVKNMYAFGDIPRSRTLYAHILKRNVLNWFHYNQYNNFLYHQTPWPLPLVWTGYLRNYVAKQK